MKAEANCTEADKGFLKVQLSWLVNPLKLCRSFRPCSKVPELGYKIISQATCLSYLAVQLANWRRWFPGLKLFKKWYFKWGFTVMWTLRDLVLIWMYVMNIFFTKIVANVARCLYQSMSWSHIMEYMKTFP